MIPTAKALVEMEAPRMLDQVVGTYRKLEENQAFSVLRHPRVITNFLRHRHEIRARPLVMRSRPCGVEIELTNRCNLACIQCLRSRGLKPYELGDIKFEDFRSILAQFPDTLNLCLNGFGEPLLHPQFFDLLAYARSRLPWAKIVIYSNGMRLDDAACERLSGGDLTEVNVSIDAADPATYKRVRRGGDLGVVHDNLRRLLRARRHAGARLPLVGVNYVLLNENEGELVPFIEQVADIGVDFVNCITYATYDWGFRNRRSPDDYRSELDAARERLAALGLRCRSFPSDDLSWTDPKHPFDCNFFWGGSARVAYNGALTLGCCTPFKETYSYGNLLETPFDEIWNGELFRRNRRLALAHEYPTPSCASCDRVCKTFFDHDEGHKQLPVYGAVSER
jgi:MoaA/NifB/PqqE/SkfB family radical SAM enzyme